MFKHNDQLGQELNYGDVVVYDNKIIQIDSITPTLVGPSRKYKGFDPKQCIKIDGDATQCAVKKLKDSYTHTPEKIAPNGWAVVVAVDWALMHKQLTREEILAQGDWFLFNIPNDSKTAKGMKELMKSSRYIHERRKGQHPQVGIISLVKSKNIMYRERSNKLGYRLASMYECYGFTPVSLIKPSLAFSAGMTPKSFLSSKTTPEIQDLIDAAGINIHDGSDFYYLDMNPKEIADILIKYVD